MFLKLMEGYVLLKKKNAHMWLLESGATFHVTPNLEWFSNYVIEMSGTIKLSNG